METIDKIRAEIERIKKQDAVPFYPEETADQYYARGVLITCYNLLSFLDTLEEKPVEVKFKPGMKNVLDALRPCNSEKPNNHLEGLDEAALEYVTQKKNNWLGDDAWEFIFHAFKAGAEWQATNGGREGDRNL